MSSKARSLLKAPKHKLVRDALARRIDTGVYAPGTMIPPEQDLCLEFGVSRITVRQAMASLVSEGLLNRHRGRGTFVHKPDDQNTNRERCISLIMCNDLGLLMSQLIRGVEQAVAQAGYDLMVRFSNDDVEQEKHSLDQASDRRVAGVLIYPTGHPSEAHPNCFHFLKLEQAGIPTMFLDCSLSQLPLGFATSANFEGMKLLTEHLLDQGHQRIMYLNAVTSVSSLQQRLKGFEAALRSRKLMFEPADVIPVQPREEGADDIEQARKAVSEFLASGGKLSSAMLGANSYYAIGAFQALKEAGIRVPDDIALAGYDDPPEAAVLEVPLTTLRVPVAEIGAAAARALLQCIQKKTGTQNQRIMMPGELIARASSSLRIRNRKLAAQH